MDNRRGRVTVNDIATTILVGASLRLRSTTGLLDSGTSESEEENSPRVPQIVDQSFEWRVAGEVEVDSPLAAAARQTHGSNLR